MFSLSVSYERVIYYKSLGYAFSRSNICIKHNSGATLDILEILEYKNNIQRFVFQRPSPPKQLKRHSSSSSSPSGSFILFNEFLPSAQIWDSCLVNKLNLWSSVFDFFPGVAAALARTAWQDGGVVTENLRAAMQRCEDDAVWALHSHLRCLQDHQREGPRGSNWTGWELLTYLVAKTNYDWGFSL